VCVCVHIICTFSDAINYANLKVKCACSVVTSFSYHLTSLLSNPTIKREVSVRIDTLLMCAPTPPPPTRWTTTTGPTHHQEKKCDCDLTARSKLSLLLLRCVTPAPAVTVIPQGPQTYRRIQPLAFSKVGIPLLRRAHVADSPRACYPAMGITPTSRIRDAT